MSRVFVCGCIERNTFTVLVIHKNMHTYSTMAASKRVNIHDFKYTITNMYDMFICDYNMYGWSQIYMLYIYIYVIVYLTCIFVIKYTITNIYDMYICDHTNIYDMHICDRDMHVHTCMHNCIHARIHTYIHTNVHTYIHRYARVHIRVPTYKLISIHIYICIHSYLYVHESIYYRGTYIYI